MDGGTERQTGESEENKFFCISVCSFLRQDFGKIFLRSLLDLGSLELHTWAASEIRTALGTLCSSTKYLWLKITQIMYGGGLKMGNP